MGLQVPALLRALRPHRRTLTLGDALLALPDYQVSPLAPCGGALAASRHHLRGGCSGCRLYVKGERV
jgi:hypothetical protein